MERGRTTLRQLTRNKFDALEVEEIDQPTLRITDGKGEGNSKAH